jgi:hypothetical protein
MESIGNVYRVVKAHVGSGGEAHKDATWYGSGFLSSEFYKRLNRLHLTGGTPKLIVSSPQDWNVEGLKVEEGISTFACLSTAVNGTGKSIRGIAHATAMIGGNPDSIYYMGVDIDGNMWSNYYTQSGGWKGWTEHARTIDTGWITGASLVMGTGNFKYRQVTRGTQKVLQVSVDVVLSGGVPSTQHFATIPSPYNPTGLIKDLTVPVFMSSSTEGTKIGVLTLNQSGQLKVFPQSGGVAGSVTVNAYFDVML